MLPVTRLVTLLVTSWPVQETPPYTSDTSTRCLFVCFMCNRPALFVFVCVRVVVFVRDDSLCVRPGLCLCVCGWSCTLSAVACCCTPCPWWPVPCVATLVTCRCTSLSPCVPCGGCCGACPGSFGVWVVHRLVSSRCSPACMVLRACAGLLSAVLWHLCLRVCPACAVGWRVRAVGGVSTPCPRFLGLGVGFPSLSVCCLVSCCAWLQVQVRWSQCSVWDHAVLRQLATTSLRCWVR